MRKKWIALFLPVLIALSCCICIPAFADNQAGYVVDEASVLTESERAELNNTAAQLADSYGCGVYLFVLDDYSDCVDAHDIAGAARSIYDEYELGTGQEKSGILLLLSMDKRDFVLYANGYGNTAFTDFGKDYLEDAFLDDFGDDDWYKGFSDYVAVSGDMLKMARDGSPVDADNAPAPPYARVYGIIACIVSGFLIAFIVRGVLKGQLKSVASKTQAAAYVAAKGLQLTDKYDRYTHTTQSRIYDPPKDNKSSGGTTLDSFGGSSRSGKF